MRNGELVLLGVGGAVVLAAWFLSRRASESGEGGVAAAEGGAPADFFGGGGQFTGVPSEGQGEFSGTPFFGQPDAGDTFSLGSPPGPSDAPFVTEGASAAGGGVAGESQAPASAPFFNRNVFEGLTPLDLAIVGSIAIPPAAYAVAKASKAARAATPPPAPEAPSTGTFRGRPGSSRIATIQESPGPTIGKGAPPRATTAPPDVSKFRTVSRLGRVARAAGVAGAAVGTAITGAEVVGGIAAGRPEQVAAAVGATPEQVAQRRSEGAAGFARLFGENLFNVFVRQPVEAVASLVPSAQAAPSQVSFTPQRGPVPGISVGGIAPRFPLLEAQQARILADRQARFEAQRAASQPATAPRPPAPSTPSPARTMAPPPKTSVRTLPTPRPAVTRAPRTLAEVPEEQRRLFAGV